MMSLLRSSANTSPPRNIGCQDLLSRPGVSHSGMLTKQLTHRRHQPLLALVIKSLPWVDRYVVLSNGWLFHYTSSQAKKPSGAYSLNGYHQVIRAGEIPSRKHPWAFKLVNLLQPNRTKHFAASSEREMKEWMTHIRSELIVANAEIIRAESLTVPNDNDCETSIYGSSVEKVKAKYSGSERQTSESEEDEEDYYEIDEPINKSVKAKWKEESDVSKAVDHGPSLPSQVKSRPPMPLPEEIAESEHKPPDTPEAGAPSTSPGWQAPGNEGDVSPKTVTASTIPKPLPTKVFSPKPLPRPRREPLPGPTSPQASPIPSPSKPEKMIQKNEACTSFSGRTVPAPPYDKPKEGRKPAQASRTKPATFDEAYWPGSDKQEADRIISDIGKEGVFLIREREKNAKTLVCYADGKAVKYKIEQAADSMYYIHIERKFANVTALLEYYSRHNLPNKSTPLRGPYVDYYDDSDYSYADPMQSGQ